MLKSLFATCLTALSVNTQPLAVPPSLEPSCAISDGTIDSDTFYTIRFVKGDDIDNPLFDNMNNVSFNLVSFDTNLSISIDNPLNVDYTTTFFNDASIYFWNDDTVNIGFVFDNSTYFVNLYTSFTLDTITNDYFLEFTIKSSLDFEGSFYPDFFPYITKVGKPYIPPSKSNLYRLLYDFYYSIFNDDDLTAIITGYNMPFDNWLAHTCTIATLITLIVVAFFFLRWLFRVISGLVLLKR